MFVRLCLSSALGLLSALTTGALAGPALSAGGASAAASEKRDGQPIVVAQLQRFITPHKIHVRPQAAPCPNYFGQC